MTTDRITLAGLIPVDALPTVCPDERMRCRALGHLIPLELLPMAALERRIAHLNRQYAEYEGDPYLPLLILTAWTRRLHLLQ